MMNGVVKMARKPRVHYPGALYHVIVRGNNGEAIFNEEKQKDRYLEILAFYKETLGFLLYAYCIMSNHAHLLIEVIDLPLSRIMQRVQQVYTQWFNRNYNRTGHIFQQRYKALLCDKDNYLLQLIRYIYNNPVKANLEEGINYRWSSHASYLGKKCDLVDSAYVLGLFSDDRNRARQEYLRFMNQVDTKLIYKDAEKEIQLINLAAEKKREEQEKYLDIDELIEKVCIAENVTIKDLIRRTRVRKISDIRKAIVQLSELYCNVSNRLLAQKLNLSPSMISKIKSDGGKDSNYVAKIISRCSE